ncbi:MAG: gliding motility-associated C-terminal domain-containing protein, partial [Bacteroidota bacterium]
AFGTDHVASIKSMRIVDRWGSVLYAAQNLQINNEATGWDGTLNGETVKTGVYIYVVEIQFTDGESEVFQGDLTLIQ